MLTNVESLKTLYTKLGGALTDTYPNIAGGIPVGEYDLISDCILACSEKSSGETITVDSELDDDSDHPVQNKVITAALADKADTADLKEPLIVTGTWASSGSVNTVTITTPLADIYAAADAGRAVILEYTNTDPETGKIDTTRMGLITRAVTNGEYALGFSICIIMSDKPAVAAVEFDNSLVGEFELAVGQ